MLLYYINLDKWDIVTISDGLASNSIKDIDYYNGILYIATSMGLTTLSVDISYPIKSFEMLRNKDIYDICIFEKDLYILSSVGLFYLNILSEKIEQLSGRKFSNIENSSDRIMLSNNNGLFVLNKGKPQLLTRFDKIKNFSICNDYVWINTGDAAIIYNSIFNTKLRYNNNDGIAGKLIKNIDCNDSWVWFATNHGLSFYNWSQFHYE